MRQPAANPRLEGRLPRRSVRRARVGRSGAALLEMAIVLPLLLLFVAAIIDTGMMMHQRNVVSWIARESARKAIVHGSSAQPAMLSWGPETITWTNFMLADSKQAAEIVETVEPYAVYLNDPDASVTFEWLNETNHWGDTVRVTVSLPRRSLFPNLPGFERDALTASCTMQIAH
jgi:Flp pilus assembly protein TadG